MLPPLLLLLGLAAAPPVSALAYRPDGATLAAGTRGEVVLLQPANGSIRERLPEQADRVTALAFSPDGQRLAVASGLPAKAGELRIYPTPDPAKPTGAVTHRLTAHDDVIYALAFAPDGRLIASTGYDRLVKLWDAANGSEVRTLNDHSDAVYGLAFRPDGRLLATASADRTVKVWDVASGRRLYSLGDATDWLYACAWSPDGRHVAAAGVDKSIRIWRADERGGELVGSAFAHDKPVVKLLYSRDGKRLISAGEDRVVKVWDAAKLTEERVFPPQADDILAIALRADDKQLAIGCFDGALVLADPATGKPQSQPLPEKPQPPKVMKVEPAFGPAGSTLTLTVQGEHLGAITSAAFGLAGVKPELVPGATANRVSVRLALPAGAAPGDYPLTLTNAVGPSAPVQVTVDRFPAIPEGDGQTVPLSRTIVGQIDRAGEQDRFTLEAAARAEIGLQVTLPKGSKLKPLVTLMDGNGRTLAKGTSLAGGLMPAAGRVTVAIRDEDYRGGAEFTYRLHVGAVPVVMSAFPLGVTRGQTAKVRIEGVNLGGSRVVSVPAKADAAIGSRLPVTVPTPHGPAFGAPQLIVGEFPSVREGEVPVPGTADGRIETPKGHGDWRFRARKGERLILEVEAARLGSPLDSTLEIRNTAGEPVARAVLRCLARSATTFRDNDSRTPNIRLEAWNELAVNDFIYVGTELMRIRELPKNPDADCTFFSLDGQRRAYLDTTPTVHAKDSPIYKVSIHPPGTTFPPNGMPVFTLYFRNDDGGAGLGTESRLVFDPPADGEYVARVSDSRGWGGADYAYRLTVRPPQPDYRVSISPNAPKVFRGGAVPLTINAERIDGFEGPIELAFENVPAGFLIPPTRLESGEVTTVVALACTDTAVAPAKEHAPFTLKASATIGGKTVVRTATLGTPTPDEPGALVTTVSVPEVTIRPGGQAKVTVSIDRRGGFAGRIPLDVRGLPHGVRVIDVGLNGILVLPGQTQRTFVLQADPWVEPTRHPFVVVSRIEGKPGDFAAPSVLLKVEKPEETNRRDAESAEIRHAEKRE